jgi:thioredoxin reductase (NADPH)
MYDIIIVGAGPAGLTSALYGIRANKKVLVLEEKSYGGQIINTPKIENYPGISEISGFDFATNLYNQVKNESEIKIEKVIKIDKEKKVYTNKNTYQAQAIILATGVKNRKLGLAGEDEFLGKGISYCATCDGFFYKNKNVAVVGGGNTALEEALYLSDIASKVYLICRKNIFKGEAKIISNLKNKENIEILFNTKVVKINGDEKLSSIDIQKDDCITNLKIDALFVAVGLVPDNKNFSDVIELTDDGYIASNDGVHTSVKGIYVAGDARAKDLRQLTTAVNDGAVATSIALKEM